jgi:hypothetical protein
VIGQANLLMRLRDDSALAQRGNLVTCPSTSIMPEIPNPGLQS